jgi:hypothetical protein
MLLHDGPAGAAPLPASPASSPGPCPPDLSVIVPLLRDRGLADRAVRSWAREQTYPRERFEVVAVSDGTRPDLEVAARRALAPHDRLVTRAGAPETALWHLGAEAARAPVLLFTEGHCAADRACVAEVLAALAAGDAEAVACASAPEGSTTAAWLEDRVFQEGVETWARAGDPRMVSLRGFAVRRDRYFAAGGLDPRDHECFAERALAARLVEQGVRIRPAPRAVVVHRPNATFAGVRHDSDAYFRCEFAFRAAAGPAAERHVGPSPVWSRRGDYDRALARAALRAALGGGREILPDLASAVRGAVLGPALTAAALRAALWTLWAAARLGGPLDRALRRRFREVWDLLAESSALRALAAARPPASPMPSQGRIPITAVPSDRLFGCHPVETDPLGRALRWSGPLLALRLPVPGDTPCRVALELHPACLPARRVAVVAAGRRVPARDVTIGPAELAVRLAAAGGGPREVPIGIRCGLALRDPRRLGLALSAVRIEPLPR